MLAGACADAGGAMVLVLRKKLKCETDFLGTDFLGTDLKKEKKRWSVVSIPIFQKREGVFRPLCSFV